MLVFCLHLTFRQLEQACRRFCPRSIYTSHPPLRCRSAIIFPLFSYYSPRRAKCSFRRDFLPKGGNRSFGEIISQSGSSQLSSAWPWVLAFDAPLCRFELPILFYSRKVFQLTFSLKPVILSPCRFPPFYRHTSSVPLYYCTAHKAQQE